jgi:hypothetical protein
MSQEGQNQETKDETLTPTAEGTTQASEVPEVNIPQPEAITNEPETAIEADAVEGKVIDMNPADATETIEELADAVKNIKQPTPEELAQLQEQQKAEFLATIKTKLGIEESDLEIMEKLSAEISNPENKHDLISAVNFIEDQKTTAKLLAYMLVTQMSRANAMHMDLHAAQEHIGKADAFIANLQKQLAQATGTK